MEKLWFTKDGKDILDGIELRNGKSNPWGWSTHEVWLVHPDPFPGAKHEEMIGRLYCGEPQDMKPGFSWRMEK